METDLLQQLTLSAKCICRKHFFVTIFRSLKLMHLFLLPFLIAHLKTSLEPSYDPKALFIILLPEIYSALW